MQRCWRAIEYEQGTLWQLQKDCKTSAVCARLYYEELPAETLESTDRVPFAERLRQLRTTAAPQRLFETEFVEPRQAMDHGCRPGTGISRQHSAVHGTVVWAVDFGVALSVNLPLPPALDLDSGGGSTAEWPWRLRLDICTAKKVGGDQSVIGSIALSFDELREAQGGTVRRWVNPHVEQLPQDEATQTANDEDANAVDDEHGRSDDDELFEVLQGMQEEDRQILVAEEAVPPAHDSELEPEPEPEPCESIAENCEAAWRHLVRQRGAEVGGTWTNQYKALRGFYNAIGREPPVPVEVILKQRGGNQDLDQGLSIFRWRHICANLQRNQSTNGGVQLTHPKDIELEERIFCGGSNPERVVDGGSADALSWGKIYRARDFYGRVIGTITPFFHNPTERVSAGAALALDGAYDGKAANCDQQQHAVVQVLLL